MHHGWRVGCCIRAARGMGIMRVWQGPIVVVALVVRRRVVAVLKLRARHKLESPAAWLAERNRDDCYAEFEVEPWIALAAP